MSNNDLLKGLTKEQIAKAKACKSQEELISYAKSEGIELTEDQLEAVNGGLCEAGQCPQCGSQNTSKGWTVLEGDYGHCLDCDHYWQLKEENNQN